jgi:hypothetical protein
VASTGVAVVSASEKKKKTMTLLFNVKRYADSGWAEAGPLRWRWSWGAAGLHSQVIQVSLLFFSLFSIFISCFEFVI